MRNLFKESAILVVILVFKARGGVTHDDEVIVCMLGDFVTILMLLLTTVIGDFVFRGRLLYANFCGVVVVIRFLFDEAIIDEEDTPEELEADEHELVEDEDGL